MPKKRKLSKKIVKSQKFSNQFEFILTAKNFDRKIDQIRLLYPQIRYRLQKGFVYNILMFFKIGYSKTTKARYLEKYDMELPDYFYEAYAYPTELGSPTTAGNVINWIIDVMRRYEDKAEQTLASNPDYNLFDIYNLRSISLRFLYADDLEDVKEPNFNV